MANPKSHKNTSSVIDDYLETIKPEQKAELERIRRIAMQLAPDAEDTFAYGIPTLKYKDKNLIHFSAFAHHMSLFPGSEAIVSLHEQLDGYTTSKGTIQFTIDKPLSDELIKQIIEIRLETINKSSSSF